VNRTHSEQGQGREKDGRHEGARGRRVRHCTALAGCTSKHWPLKPGHTHAQAAAKSTRVKAAAWKGFRATARCHLQAWSRVIQAAALSQGNDLQAHETHHSSAGVKVVLLLALLGKHVMSSGSLLEGG
jgi:hypothetical protein